MTRLEKVNSMVEGKTYVIYEEGGAFNWIIKHGDSTKIKGGVCFWSNRDNYYKELVNFNKNYLNFKENFHFREATPEEEHWLSACIKKNSFVEREEALKTFNKEFSLSFDL